MTACAAESDRRSILIALVDGRLVSLAQATLALDRTIVQAFTD